MAGVKDDSTHRATEELWLEKALGGRGGALGWVWRLYASKETGADARGWTWLLCGALLGAALGGVLGGWEHGRAKAKAHHWVPASTGTLEAVARGAVDPDPKLWVRSTVEAEREEPGEARRGRILLAQACEESGRCQALGGAGLTGARMLELAERGELPADARISGRDREAAVEAVKAWGRSERDWESDGFGGRRKGALIGAVLGFVLSAFAGWAALALWEQRSERLEAKRRWAADWGEEIAERAREIEARELSRVVAAKAGAPAAGAGAKRI